MSRSLIDSIRTWLSNIAREDQTMSIPIPARCVGIVIDLVSIIDDRIEVARPQVNIVGWIFNVGSGLKRRQVKPHFISVNPKQWQEAWAPNHCHPQAMSLTLSVLQFLAKDKKQQQQPIHPFYLSLLSSHSLTLYLYPSHSLCLPVSTIAVQTSTTQYRSTRLKTSWA